jgi:hypothetical protein
MSGPCDRLGMPIVAPGANGPLLALPLQGRAGTWSSHQTAAPIPGTTISVPGALGRYVRVQLSGTNLLSLAEVQVLAM